MSGPRPWLRPALAFVASPLIASALSGFAAAVLFSDPGEAQVSGDGLGQAAALAATVAAVSAAISLPASLSIGLIAHAMFQRRGVTRLWAYVLAGAIAGALLCAILALVAPVSSMVALYGAPVGAATALFAWLICRPDREAPNPATSAP